MTDSRKKITLEDAYAVATPDDNVQLYTRWADTYDEDFVAAKGYVGYLNAAKLFLEQTPQVDGPVLDVGCGTGVVGVVLRDAGLDSVDGIDISQAMLNKAQKKKAADGRPVYRQLIQADLTEVIAIPDRTYAGIVSAGTFTHGHLGPESLDELWRIAAPGAVCSIGVNSAHFDSEGFAEKISNDVKAGIVGEPQIHIVDSFINRLTDIDAEDNQAMIIVCRVN